MTTEYQAQTVFFGTAKGYCQSALLIITNDVRLVLPGDATLIPAFYNLIGFAVELYLKAYLIENGVSEKSLRSRKYGHNLTNLLVAAKDKGFVCTHVEALCTHLHQHGSLEFRYLNVDANYHLMPPDRIFSILSDLDQYVANCIWDSFGEKKPPVGRWGVPQRFALWRG